MRKSIVLAATSLSLSLAACGGGATTENASVTSEEVSAGEGADANNSDNLVAADEDGFGNAGATDTAVGELSGNAAGNAVSNGF